MSDDNDNTDSTGGGLRKQLEDALAEKGRLASELAVFRAEKRTSTVAGILKAKGVSEAAAKLYSGEDVSEDAVGTWIAEHADVLQPSSTNSVNDANAQNAQRVTSASQGTTTATGSSGADSSGRPILGDPNEIKRLIDTLPYDELVKLNLMPKIEDNNLFARR